MKPGATGLAYDTLAPAWDAPSFDRNNGIPQHRRALTMLGAGGSTGRALDVGCGCNGRIIDCLLDAGLTVTGIDVSNEMIERARRRHPGVAFTLADICRWEPVEAIDFITAWDSIWHVPLAAHEDVLRKLFSALAPGGVCIFTLGGTETPGEMTDDAMGVEVYYSTPGVPGMLALVDACGCVCRHLEYDQYPELHTYVIVQRPG